MQVLNIPMLKQACTDNAKMQKLFEVYSDRDRGRTSCTVPRIRRIMKEVNVDLTVEETIEIMKTWQAAGCGRFVPGRRDQDNRFMWSWDIPSLAKRITAPPVPEGLAPAEILAAPRQRARLIKVPGELVPAGIRAEQVLSDTVTPTHPGLKVRFKGFEIELPKDLSQEELSDAQAFIHNLRAQG